MSREREADQCHGAVAARRRRGLDVGGESPTTTTAAARRRCRSCAAFAIADCVALGCCPCAVVSLLGLALVKAPLVVGRRCVGRLRRRRRLLLLDKRVRDVAADEEKKGGDAKKLALAPGPTAGIAPDWAVAGGPTTTTTGLGTTEAELAWLEEMYRVGHWGFGRVSFSGESPVKS
ncbi:hypothetical protein PR202_ga06005 [Eleusine coracana subsp. coracana]|uniref:Uncharacterized protein n=1 Tax=Eleusine coracana subsp. coracana TaxID=191504 RepID=A0AAV5BVL7_ELECO|nr:hypothetical protein PR202_ga06005 [Eleusine coracana subsp. coracana]